MSGGTHCSRSRIFEFTTPGLRILPSTSKLVSRQRAISPQHVTLTQASRPSTTSATGNFAGTSIEFRKRKHVWLIFCPLWKINRFRRWKYYQGKAPNRSHGGGLCWKDSSGVAVPLRQIFEPLSDDHRGASSRRIRVARSEYFDPRHFGHFRLLLVPRNARSVNQHFKRFPLGLQHRQWRVLEGSDAP